MAHSLMESLVLERQRRTRVVRQKMMNHSISSNPAFIQDSSVYIHIWFYYMPQWVYLTGETILLALKHFYRKNFHIQ